MTEIYFGLIGCSGIAKKHAESLRRIEGVALSAVCDLNAARAEQLGQAYGVNHYANYRRMLESEKIDVVIVNGTLATPTSLTAPGGMVTVAGTVALVLLLDS